MSKKNILSTLAVASGRPRYLFVHSDDGILLRGETIDDLVRKMETDGYEIENCDPYIIDLVTGDVLIVSIATTQYKVEIVTE